MTYALGVDLGTTYTAAAVWADGGSRMFTLGNHNFAVPSAVYVQGSGTFAFGEAAVQRGRLDPDGLAVEFKRRIGDVQPLRLHGRPFSPEQLSARLLAWVLSQVGEQEGEAPGKIVVTHPANWHDVQIDKLDEIVATAGLRDYSRISEPEAAALFYASQTRVPTGSLLAVYDLGGGTFDASILHKLDDRFEIVGAPEGIERLGGIDFDDVVVGFVKANLAPGTLEDLDLEDARIVRDLTRLRSDCTEAKEALSNDAEAVVAVNLGDLRTEVRITRREFEAAVEPYIQDTADTLQRAIDNSGAQVSDLTSILLVGGSSRIPLVARVLTAAFERPIALDAHPKNATALGAAMFTAVSETTTLEPGGSRFAGAGPGAALSAPAPADSRFATPPAPAVVRTASTGMRRGAPPDFAAPVQPPAAAAPSAPAQQPPAAAPLQPAPLQPAPLQPAPLQPVPGPVEPAGPQPVPSAPAVQASAPSAPQRPLPLDVPPPGGQIGYSSPIVPEGRWGRASGTEGRGMRVGNDGKLYSEEHAAANAERARQAEAAAATARALAARRLRLALGGAGIAVAVVVVLVLAMLR